MDATLRLRHFTFCHFLGAEDGPRRGSSRTGMTVRKRCCVLGNLVVKGELFVEVLRGEIEGIKYNK